MLHLHIFMDVVHQKQIMMLWYFHIFIWSHTQENNFILQDSDNDKDYIPEEGDASSDEAIVVELIPKIQRFQKKTASTLPPVESLQSRERDESSAEAHKTNITIAQTNNSEYRHYDKRFYCMFCEKAQTKLKKTFAFAA